MADNLLETLQLDLDQVRASIQDMIEAEPNTQGMNYGAQLAAQASVMRGGEEPIKDYKISLLEEDKEALINNEFSIRTKEKIDTIDQFIRDLPQVDPVNLGQNLTYAPELYNQASDVATSPIGIERQVVEDSSNISTENMSLKELAERVAASKLAMYNDIASILDKQDLWDKVVNFSGFFIPFNYVKDTSDIVDIAEKEGKLLEGVDGIVEFIAAFQSLPIERREEYWPYLKDVVLRATEGNEIKASIILDNFLDPESPFSVQVERGIDIAGGLADVFGVGAVQSIFKKIWTITKAEGSLVKTLKDVNNIEDAAEINIGAIVDPEISAGAGVSKQDAYNNSLPFFRESSIDPSYTSGLDIEVQKRLNELNKRGQDILLDFSQERSLIREGVLRKGEKIARRQKVLDLLEAGKSDRLTEEGYAITNIKASEPNETGFNISYDIVDPETKKVIESVKDTVTWGINDVTGNFIETIKNINPINTKAGSPTLFSKGDLYTDFLGSVKTAIRLDEIQAGLRFEISGLMEQALSPLKGLNKKKSIDKIDKVLIAGDEYIDPLSSVRGRVFTVEELMAGVDTKKGTIALTDPREIEAYYGMRQVADSFWSYENHVARRKLDLQGFKNAMIEDMPQVGKPLERLQDAKNSIGSVPKARMFDPDKKEILDYSPKKLESYYDKGYQLVRIHGEDGYKPAVVRNAPSDEVVDYVLVRKESISDLPEQVLHYKIGYVPKINKGVEFLVKEKVPTVTKNGRDLSRLSTLRFFSSKKLADEYRESLVAKAIDDLPNDLTTAQRERKIAEIKDTYKVESDRELTPEQKMGETFSSSGGLYTGPRSKDDILSGLSGQDTERLSAFEAFDRNTSHLASVMSRNEWRIGEEQRWLNTAREVLGYEGVTTFRDTPLPDTKEGRALAVLRDRIKIWNNVPTRDEHIFRGMVQSFHDWALYGTRKVPGLQNKESIKSLLWLKHSDPYAAAKAAAFHTLLGVGNPVQLFVQGQAATVALSRFEKFSDAPRAVKSAFTLGLLDNIHDTRALREQYRLISKDPELSLSEIEEMHSAWLRTGLRDSVRTNADILQADQGIGTSLSSFRKALDKGLIFYRTGELFNRRTSFSMAYLNWKRKNPNKIPNNEALKEILSETNLSMLELGKANRAVWQGGPNRGAVENILGVMSQFSQVLAKTTQLAFLQGGKSGGFTGTEKAKILAGQAFWYGSAGIPLGSAVLPAMMELYGIDPKDMDESTINAINQGMVGVLALDAFGADIDIANRAAVIGNIAQFYKDMLFSDTPMSARVLGAFGNVADRSFSAFGQIAPLALSGVEGREMTKTDMLIAASELGKISTTGNNLWKAYMMHNFHKIVDNRNNPLLVEDFNLSTEIGAALGFKPTPESRIRILQKDNKTVSERINASSEAIVHMYYNYLILGEDSGLPPNVVANMITMMVESEDDPIIRGKIINSVKDKIFDKPKTLEAKELKRWFERDGPNKVADGLNFLERIGREQAIIQPIGNQQDAE